MICALALLISANTPNVVFCCRPDNDLYSLAVRLRSRPSRFDTVAAALKHVRPGSGLLVLDGKALTNQTVSDLARKSVKVYEEIPPATGVPLEDTLWERAFVQSEAFGSNLKPGRILSIGRQHLPTWGVSHPMISIGRVAGFDQLAFGTPAHSIPMMWMQTANLLESSVEVSRFAKARYAPAKAWREVIRKILTWAGAPVSGLDKAWQPSVVPSFEAKERLPAVAQEVASYRAALWITQSHLLVDAAADKIYAQADQWPDRVGSIPTGSGDGSLGMLEGFSSAIDSNGLQPVRWYRRADCNAEAAMTLALAGTLDMPKIGERLAKYIVETSSVQHNDPTKGSYGLVGWNDQPGNRGTFYGDDNARYILGLIGAAGALKTNRFDDAILRCILANFRTSGLNGFRGNALVESDIERLGWKHFFEAPTVNLAPHFEAYQWACWLWAYQKTGYRPLLDRAEKAIDQLMTAGEDAWTWTNGIQQERVRMLLPLSWLIRVSDTPQHRKWLNDVLDRVLAHQDASGAIREEIADLSHGIAGPPRSNDAFGTAETPLIQENGDPLADMLYTSNFALLGLHEAAMATKDPRVISAEDALADFLIRIQIHSKQHPELDGAWFRAFDFGDWDYWASNADLGWGAWSVESGWSVAWIASVLELRVKAKSLWEIHSKFKPNLSLVEHMMGAND